MERIEQTAEGIAMTAGFTKSAPVAAGGIVSSLNFFGVSVPDLVPFLTAIYLVVMILHSLWKWLQEWRHERKIEREQLNE